MTVTARSWLSDLTDLCTPTQSQFDGVRSRRASAEARLVAVFAFYRMFEIGSLSDGSGVWRYSDTDYLVSLKGDKPSSPWTTLTNVKEALQERFTSTNIDVHRPAAVCYFSDEIVEVVPGFISVSGYLIADPTGGWMTSHPEGHNKYVNDANKKYNGGAKTLARQVKTLKYLREVPASSCYLEMQVAKHLDGESGYSPLWDLYLALSKMYEVDLASMDDPTGLGPRLSARSSDATRATSLSRLSTAVGRARKAGDFDSDGRHAEAIGQLKLLINRLAAH